MGGAAASADPNALNRYRTQLSSALRRRFRYPRVAQVQGASGTAIVRFTMTRSGRVVSAFLVRSTGSGVLDQAALATVVPGTSLPPPSDTVQELTYTVPLQFDLR
ncbi:energy transducer TonB family protein [Microvirga roseola]|uniref:energy transducer TonB family protein n=1 Tax=Microvirga roseola TaxID=2883126 RepID=UPI003898FB2F